MMDKLKVILICLLFLASSPELSAQKLNLNIVYIGDSITQGVQLDDPGTEAPPATASKWLRKQKGIGEVKFSNQGVSGYTTVDFLPSTHTVFDRAHNAATTLNDKRAMLIFSIMLGTNDSASDGPNGSPVSAQQYYDNMKAIIDRLLHDFPSSTIMIQRPTWYSPNTYNGARYLQDGLNRLQSYFPEIDKLVTNYNSTNAGHVFASDAKAFDYFKKNYLTELKPEPGREGIFHLHPNKKGAETLGAFWGKAIYQMVENKTMVK
jgi:lysophospholipase L1-like esterase